MYRHWTLMLFFSVSMEYGAQTTMFSSSWGQHDKPSRCSRTLTCNTDVDHAADQSIVREGKRMTRKERIIEPRLAVQSRH
jgi:hypothetical protein